MSERGGKLFLGSMLILFGGLWLASSFIPEFRINWGLLWPIFLLIPGLFFWGKFLFSRNRTGDIGLVIPGTILVCLALVFFINTVGSSLLKIDGLWLFTAFMYPGSVALSFLLAWLFSRENTFLIPAFILLAITGLVFCATTSVAILGGSATADINRVLLPIILVCVGVFVLINPFWVAVFRGKDGKWGGKTEQEWKSWGENLGKKMERMGEDISRSIENALEPGSTDSKKAADKNHPPRDAQEAELVESMEIKPTTGSTTETDK